MTATTIDYETPNDPKRSPRRWVIAGLLFLAAVLNYVDRNVLGLLAPTIQEKLHISDAQYALIGNGFLVCYTIAYLFSGRLVDRLGTRAAMALFLGVWSAANALTGFAQSALSLGVFRSLLGLGEAGGYTGSPAAVAEWFGPKERARVAGFYSAGGTVGATLAPLLVIGLSARFGWQAAFIVTGLAGLLWIVPWLLVYPRRLAGARRTGPAVRERDLWAAVVRQPAAWRLMAARLLTDAVWYFYLFWMPKYLHEVRGVPQAGLSVIWVIFATADIGFLVGGIASDKLIARGAPPATARLWLLTAAALLIPASVLVPLSPTLSLALAAASVVTFAHAVWLGNITTLVIDAIPAPLMATTFGFVAAGSAAGGIAMNTAVSFAVTHHSYDSCFYSMAVLHLLAVSLLWPLRKTLKTKASIAADVG